MKWNQLVNESEYDLRKEINEEEDFIINKENSIEMKKIKRIWEEDWSTNIRNFQEELVIKEQKSREMMVIFEEEVKKFNQQVKLVSINQTENLQKIVSK